MRTHGSDSEPFRIRWKRVDKLLLADGVYFMHLARAGHTIAEIYGFRWTRRGGIVEVSILKSPPPPVPVDGKWEFEDAHGRYVSGLTWADIQSDVKAAVRCFLGPRPGRSGGAQFVHGDVRVSFAC